MPGSVELVGQYEYDKTSILGHGAFAVVYRGKSRVSPTHSVAVKCISKKQNSKKLISAEEINILKEIQHENVVQLFDFKETDKSLVMVMEFCNGGDLAEYLRDKGMLPETTVSLFVKQLGAAMCAIHKMGVIHRDLKPGNILLSHSSSLQLIHPRDIKLKIADFGFARFLNDEDMAATLCGSPIYMAPEVLMGKHYDARVDLWSLGTIIYQCFTGKAPFKANNPYALRSYYEEKAELVPLIPKSASPELTSLIMALLQKNPDKRIPFDDLVNHKFLTEGEDAPVPVQYPSPRASPSSSPSHPIARSPRSASSSKLASLGRMRRNTAPSKPTMDIATRAPHGITESISESPDTEGFIVVNTKNSPSTHSPSKLKAIESSLKDSFMHKSVAISSSIKTKAMAVPLKHGYSTEHLADFSPRATSPLKTAPAETSAFRRDSPHRLSGMRSGAPNIIRRAWSMEGTKRHRTSSDSARQGSPPKNMELVSRSVRQSPSRRPFSDNFEDSQYYTTPSSAGVPGSRPLSASNVATGTSAPAYFFIGGSPYDSPPSLREQSPMQALTMGDVSPPYNQPFASPPDLQETTIMDEHQREMLDEFQAAYQYCLAIREAANLIEKPFSPTDFRDKMKLHQKLLLCQKSEFILSSTITTAKTQLLSKKISPSKTFKEVLYSVYGEFCAVHVMREQIERELAALNSTAEERLADCAEHVLLAFAFAQIRSGILDENYGHIGECVKRYRLSLAIIIGLIGESHSESDRRELMKYENRLNIRIESLGRRRLAAI